MTQATEHFETALAHQRAGRTAEAAQAYLSTLSGEPDHVGALFNLAVLKSHEGQDREAESYFRQVLEISPNDANAWLNLGTLLYAQNRPAEASDAFAHAAQAVPDNASAHRNLGAALFAQGKFADAAAAIQRAVDLEPANPDNRLTLGTVLSELQDFDGAIDQFDRACTLRPGWAAPALEKAETLIRCNRSDEAINVYRDALRDTPTDPSILLPLAGLLIKRGEHAEAESLLDTCRSANPSDANTEFTIANLRIAEGRYQDALQHLERTRALVGDVPEILNNMGTCHYALRNFDDAVAVLEGVVASHPEHVDALNNLGSAYLAKDEPARALDLFGKAYERDSSSAQTAHNLARAAQDLNRLGEAESWYRRAVTLAPTGVRSINGLGNVLSARGEYEEAIGEFQKAVDLAPTDVTTLYNLSVCLKESGQATEAFEVSWAALQVDPLHAPTMNALGTALSAMKSEEIESVYNRVREALEREASNVAVRLIADTFESVPEQKSIAVAFFQKALELEPDNLDALRHIASHYESLRMYKDASAAYLRVLERKPDHAESLAHITDCLLFLCDWTDYSGLKDSVLATTQKCIDNDTPITTDIINLHALPVTNEFTYAAARNKAKFIAANAVEAKQRLDFTFAKPRREKVRIGYLLPYTWFSSMPLVLKEIVERHDRDRFEILGYSIQESDDTEFDKEFRAAFDQFKNVPRSSAERAARAIHADDVDILIDTTGHTSTTCLPIMALRPAPVQAHYLGYGLTSGSDFLDYLITDPVYIPPELQNYCSEKLVYLPHSFMATTRAPISKIQLSRADFDLPEDAFVFCNFNLSVKFEPTIFNIWMRILERVPNSVMWFGVWSRDAVKNLRKEAEARGVDGDRLVFSRVVKHPIHLARLKLADLALDNLYHGGGITTVDYMWAGLPIVTIAGETSPSRLGATVTSAAGVPELITESIEEFEDRAVHYATNADDLGAIRTKIEANRDTCPLFDQESYVRHLERGYQLMWERYASGDTPTHISIPRDL